MFSIPFFISRKSCINRTLEYSVAKDVRVFRTLEYSAGDDRCQNKQCNHAIAFRIGMTYRSVLLSFGDIAVLQKNYFSKHRHSPQNSHLA